MRARGAHNRIMTSWCPIDHLLESQNIPNHCPKASKVKIVPYTLVRRGVPVREGTYPEPSACEVRWPVPFLAAFVSPVFPLGAHLLLGEQ